MYRTCHIRYTLYRAPTTAADRWMVTSISTYDDEMMTTMMLWWLEKKYKFFSASFVLLLWCFLRTYNRNQEQTRARSKNRRVRFGAKQKRAPSPPPPPAVSIWTPDQNNYAKDVWPLYQHTIDRAIIRRVSRGEYEAHPSHTKKRKKEKHWKSPKNAKKTIGTPPPPHTIILVKIVNTTEAKLWYYKKMHNFSESRTKHNEVRHQAKGRKAVPGTRETRPH